MTHRAGFSETARDLLSFGKAPPPLDTVLKRYVPPRIFAPDEGPGYSNYGASLAGYIVQRVSGEKFEAYVEQHIFAPLGMSHLDLRAAAAGGARPGHVGRLQDDRRARRRLRDHLPAAGRLAVVAPATTWRDS